jgi:hypothetical protein
MGELLDFTKKNLIPPYEDLTFEVLRVTPQIELISKNCQHDLSPNKCPEPIALRI